MSTMQDGALSLLAFVTRAGDERWTAYNVHSNVQAVAHPDVFAEPGVEGFVLGLQTMLPELCRSAGFEFKNPLYAFCVPDAEWPMRSGAVTIPLEHDGCRHHYLFFPRRNFTDDWLWKHEGCHALVGDNRWWVSLLRDEGWAHVVPLGDSVSIPGVEDLVEFGLSDPHLVDAMVRNTDEEEAQMYSIRATGWLMAHLMRRRGAPHLDVLDAPRSALPTRAELLAHFENVRWEFAVEQGLRLSVLPDMAIHDDVLRAARVQTAATLVEALVPGVRGGEAELIRRFGVVQAMAVLVCMHLKSNLRMDDAGIRSRLKDRNDFGRVWDDVRRRLR